MNCWLLFVENRAKLESPIGPQAMAKNPVFAAPGETPLAKVTEKRRRQLLGSLQT